MRIPTIPRMVGMRGKRDQNDRNSLNSISFHSVYGNQQIKITLYSSFYLHLFSTFVACRKITIVQTQINCFESLTINQPPTRESGLLSKVDTVF